MPWSLVKRNGDGATAVDDVSLLLGPALAGALILGGQAGIVIEADLLPGLQPAIGLPSLLAVVGPAGADALEVVAGHAVAPKRVDSARVI